MWGLSMPCGRSTAPRGGGWERHHAELGQRGLYYESRYVVAWVYGACGNTCMEVAEGTAPSWLLFPQEWRAIWLHRPR